MSLTPRADRISKNFIINGAFDFWQRSTSFSEMNEISGYNSADRFQLETTNTSGTRQVQRVLDSPNSKTKYSGELLFDSTGTSTFKIAQRIESVFARSLSGEKISISGQFKTDEFTSVRVILNVADAENDYVSSTEIYNQVFTLSNDSSWHKIEIENILLSNVSNGLEVIFQAELPNEGANNHSFRFSQLKLAVGEKVQDFNTRDYDEELQLCQRYFEKSYDIDVNVRTISDAGTIADINPPSSGDGLSHRFRVSKRDIPMITSYSPRTGNPNVLVQSNTGGDVGCTPVNINTNGFQNNSGTTDSFQRIYHFTADAEI